MGVGMNLKKFNQVALAIALTLFLLFAVGIGVLIFFEMNRSHSGPTRHVVVDSESTSEDEPSVPTIFCLPIYETGTGFVAVVEVTSNVSRSKLGGSSYQESWERDPICRLESAGRVGSMRNIVLIPADAAQPQRVLFDRPVLIAHVELPPDPEDDDDWPPPGRIYWTLREEDSNNDGVIDENDAKSAYFSSLDGTEMQRLTPPGAHLAGLKTFVDEGFVVMVLQYDSDGNGKLDLSDRTEWVRVFLDNPLRQEPLLDSGVVAQALGHSS